MNELKSSNYIKGIKPELKLNMSVDKITWKGIDGDINRVFGTLKKGQNDADAHLN